MPSATYRFPALSNTVAVGSVNEDALTAAGVYDSKHDFDTEYMIDHLLSHPIHEQVMNDIDAKLGKRADAYYHAVFAVLISDLRR